MIEHIIEQHSGFFHRKNTYLSNFYHIFSIKWCEGQKDPLTLAS